jgi:hypothetical protein
MRTQTIDCTFSQARLTSGLLSQARALEMLAALATRVARALLPGLALLVAANWAVAEPGMAVYLQAMLSAGSFVFLALAVESESSRSALANLLTGIAMGLLTWMSGSLALELAIVATALVAVRTAVALFRRS